MFVFTGSKGVIIAISETLDREDNGNYLVYNGTLAIPEALVEEIGENIVVPEGVGVQTHKWTAKDGFSINPNYIPQQQPDNERIKELEQALNILMGGADNELDWSSEKEA